MIKATRPFLTAFLLVFLTGCDGNPFGTLEAEFVTPAGSSPAYEPEPQPVPEAPLDADGDGVTAKVDCNDKDASVGSAKHWLADVDTDGWGASNGYTTACDQPTGMVEGNKSGDCNDNDADVHPDATEVCDSKDNDCNGGVDDAIANVWYHDGDADGYGDPDQPFVNGCDGSSFLSAESGDCDDNDADIHPGATEVCDLDRVDEDCDGLADDDDPSVDPHTMGTSYADGDSDGFGDPEKPYTSCWAPPQNVKNDDDCDDVNSLWNPNSGELCDGIDNNCDGQVDESEPDVNLCDDDNPYTTDMCEGDSGCAYEMAIVHFQCELPDELPLDLALIGLTHDDVVCGAGAFYESAAGAYGEKIVQALGDTLTLSLQEICEMVSAGAFLHVNAYVMDPSDYPVYWVGGQYTQVQVDGQTLEGSQGVVTLFYLAPDFVYDASAFEGLCQP